MYALEASNPDKHYGKHYALEASNLGKRYGKHWALRNCSLQVPMGSVTGLIGLNGAGKTTLIHLAMGLIRSSEGSISVLGSSPDKQLADLLPRVGFVPQERAFYKSVSDAQRFCLLGSRIRAAPPHRRSGGWGGNVRKAHVSTPPTRAGERRRREPALKSQIRHALEENLSFSCDSFRLFHVSLRRSTLEESGLLLTFYSDQDKAAFSLDKETVSYYFLWYEKFLW